MTVTYLHKSIRVFFQGVKNSGYFWQGLFLADVKYLGLVTQNLLRY